jgi:gliding motility-associated-like protein
MKTVFKSMSKLSILSLLLFFISIQLNAQLFNNNGADIVMMEGVYVGVDGDFLNDNAGELDIRQLASVPAVLTITGDFTNDATTDADGVMEVEGDWFNNSVFNAGVGSVFLNGANQNLGGTQSTTFNLLDLSGTGIKTMAIDQYVSGHLSLNDRELATETYTMHVENVSTTAITRTTGFVSSLDGGYLSRNTASDSTYLYPVGSSQLTARYRPIEIAPTSSSANTYVVRMANLDATTEGYNRNALDQGICIANPDFYHQIDRTAGSDAIDLTYYYDEAIDGLWDNIGYWTATIPQWEEMTNTTHQTGTPFNTIEQTAWNNFSEEAYILINPLADATIDLVSAMCSNESPIQLNTAEPGGTWFGSGVNSSGLFDPFAAGAGTHQIIYTIADPCGDSDTLDITVHETQSIILGSVDESCNGANDGVAWVDIYNGTQPYSIIWSNGLGTDTIQPLAAPAWYSVLVTDANNCEVLDSVFIYRSTEDCIPPHIYIPNIFSPNGDGNNDILYVYGKGIEDLSLIIYNRWGEKVFETKDMLNGWDGTHKGKLMDPAVFVYYLKASLEDGQDIDQSGNITLVK